MRTNPNRSTTPFNGADPQRLSRRAGIRGAALAAAAATFGLSASVHGQDTAVGPMVINRDTTVDFRADGSLTSTDNAPLAGLNPGPNLPIIGVNWEFQLRNRVLSWDVTGFEQGAQNASIGLRGQHTNSPAGHGHVDPNPLPEIISFPIYADFGVAKRMTKSGAVHHNDHWDGYAVETVQTAVNGVARSLAGASTRIVAKHRDTERESRAELTGIGSSAGRRQPTAVSYDAGNGTLSFQIGEINVADGVGGQTGDVDPAYASDPVLGGQMSVDDLHFEGLAPDGRYQFSGGTVTIADPGGVYHFVATFGEFLIGDTSRTGVVDSYGALTSISVTDNAELADAASLLLQDFVAKNVLGTDVSEELWAGIAVNDFSFSTAINLADMTNGFSSSVSDVPADALIFANFNIPEPASVVLLAAGVLGVLKRRRTRA